jgi:hypothetical protein
VLEAILVTSAAMIFVFAIGIGVWKFKDTWVSNWIAAGSLQALLHVLANF